jgi:nicotinamidase-related amidase
MPAKNQDLHGNVPDEASIALLLIDVINDLEFEDGAELFKYALPAARNIAALKRLAKRVGIPVVYVNDNFGRWQSDLNKLVAHCLQDDVRGKPIVELLQPDEDDYFVLKPKQSGFFSTTLDTLIDYLQVNTLILVGFTGNICVLFTAHDAYMRDLQLIVPRDCIASVDPEANEQTLQHIATVLKGNITPSDQLNLDELQRQAQQGHAAADAS